jgi:hypothetical protein
VAIDLTGISNVNEFYSHHYLDALLDSDLKDLLAKWDDAEQEHNRPAPHKSLARCGADFFKAKTRAEQTVSVEDRFAETHAINVQMAEALGYPYQHGAYELVEENQVVPVLASLTRDGNPHLWIVEAPFPSSDADDDTSTFEQHLLHCQHPADAKEFSLPKGVNWESLFSLIFRRDDPPRWVMLLAGSEIYLVERHKWGQGKYLLFDMDEIFGRKSADGLRATAALLSRDALCPDDGTLLHDTLDENSHKHAFSVSEDLKYGIRRAVELLGNEYVWYQRNVAKKALFGDEDLARKLTDEGLTYLYRLLFLFYVEARGGELDAVPMKSDEYRLGYSLEALRDLEQVILTSEESQNGYYFDESLRKLFALVNLGHDPQQMMIAGMNSGSGDALNFGAARPVQMDLATSDVGRGDAALAGNRPEQVDLGHEAVKKTLVAPEPEQQAWLDHGFTLQGLDSPLFDAKRTPLLSSIRFRNVVLQEIIQLMSLSREGGGRGRGRRRERGRISYAQLGINQLGAVYEGLLSYSGFFAQEKIYEVKPADQQKTDETQQSYFVPETEIEKYTAAEFVMEEVEGGDGTKMHRRTYEKGSFIFRLAGRDREKSASYYTPECLTQCVVKYSLKELLNDKTADDILKLRICEPAMGSAAFINEAVNQLADAYLERKQKELGQQIPPPDYAHERQRVKAYLATHNCYGVDLNPTAVDLARTSLWLNTIHRGSKCPWFGLRLAVGNSLVGCRRQVFKASDLRAKSAKENWLSLVPEHVPLGPEWKERPKNSVYHFLVPDSGMANFDSDKVIKELVPDQVKHIKDWRKDFCKPFDQHDTDQLIDLSDAIDELWKQVIRERREAVKKTNPPAEVWGQSALPPNPLMYSEQDKVAAELERPYTAYRRLKLIMDYWCALWFWPIQDAVKLPTRDVFLLDIEMILKGTAQAKGGGNLMLGLDPAEAISDDHRKFIERFGRVNVEDLCKDVERLRIAAGVAKNVRFHHWELRFAEAFADNGGFDLILGNPPWVKIAWNEGGILSEFQPLLVLRELSASNIAKERNQHLREEKNLNAYCNEFVGQTGSKAFLNATENFPLLLGMQTNLFKCFITRSWEISSKSGVVGFLHPEGIYDDPKGGLLRNAVYERLRAHFQFVNELKLFPEIAHILMYSVNTYCEYTSTETQFTNIANLYHPITISGCFVHDGHGQIPGIKTEDGKWDLRPHRSRVVHVNRARLSLFSDLYDEPNTPPMRARLPVVHSEEIVSVLEKFAAQTRRLGDLEGEYHSTVMFDETYAQRDGTIRRETRYPTDVSEWIISGPHFHVGTPLNKSPNEGCSSKGDYSKIDLTSIPADYLPRTNYVPACSPEEYRRRTPKWDGELVTKFYRLAHRRMLSPTGERTLVPCLIPPGPGHINVVHSLVFREPRQVLRLVGLFASIPYDFLLKTTGKGDLLGSGLSIFPFPKNVHEYSLIESRVVRLSCLTSHYADLWQSIEGTPWEPACAFRKDSERRMALLEIDVLAALALGLTEEELITIYRVQFPVLQQYEREDRYDRLGRQVPLEVLKMAARAGIDIHSALNVHTFRGDAALIGEVDTPALGLTGGIRWTDPKMEPRMERIYPPPFLKNDREAETRAAYQRFASLAR